MPPRPARMGATAPGGASCQAAVFDPAEDCCAPERDEAVEERGALAERRKARGWDETLTALLRFS